MIGYEFLIEKVEWSLTLISLTLLSTMNERALVFAQDDALQRAGNENREHLEQHFLVATQRQRGGVHDLQVLDDRLVECQRRIALRGRVLHRIGGVYAIHFRCLQYDIDMHLAHADRRR